MSEKDTSETVGGCLWILLSPIALMAKGWTASVLWGWFLVPTFGARAISTAEAIGVSLVVGSFWRYPHPKGGKDVSSWLLVATPYVGCAVSLAAGYIVHRWWMP